MSQERTSGGSSERKESSALILKAFGLRIGFVPSSLSFMPVINRMRAGEGSEDGKAEAVLPGHFINMLLLGCLPAKHNISHDEDHDTAQGNDENNGEDRQVLSWLSIGLPKIAIHFSGPVPNQVHCRCCFQGIFHGCRCFSLSLD